MLIKTVKSVVVGLLLSSAIAYAQEGIYFNVAEGDKESAYNEMVNNKLECIGFILSDPHERINDAYFTKYGTEGSDSYDPKFKESLDNLGFFSVANDEALRPLLLKEPSLGAFSPFNLYIYKYKAEDITRVGYVNPKIMLDITGVEDMSVRTDFIKMFEPLEQLVDTEIGGKKEVISFDKLPAKKLMEFELSFERPDDILDFVEGFQEEFEGAFEDKKYIIAGFKNFSETYTDLEADFSRYDAYFVYSLCHLKFSYDLFNYGNAQAGVFAPCSMYMYIEKESNVMKIGMAYLENWIHVAGIKDKAQIASIRKLDKDIIGIMEGLGAKLK